MSLALRATAAIAAIVAPAGALPHPGTYVCTLAAAQGSGATPAGTLVIRARGTYERRGSDRKLIETGVVSQTGNDHDGTATLVFSGRTATSMKATENGRDLRAGPTLEMPRRLDCAVRAAR
jgi:hypothetical protein